jgi:hypothetical protein
VAIRKIKDEGKCNEELVHWKRKYLNNVIEADHGKLKRLVKPTLGFKSMKTAYATLKGFEVIAAANRADVSEGSIRAMVWVSSLWIGPQCEVTGGRHAGEIRLIERQFDTYPF